MKAIVDLYVFILAIVLGFVYISGVVACAFFIPDYIFGSIFKWVVSIVLPFFAVTIFFGPLLLFVDIRNSLREIEQIVRFFNQHQFKEKP